MKRAGWTIVAMFAPGRWIIGLILGAFVGAPVAANISETAGMVFAIVIAALFVAICALADTEKLR